MKWARFWQGEHHESRIFLVLASLLYAAYALLTPPFQTPDEHQHLFRAWQLSELHLISERRGDAVGDVLPDSLGRAALPEIGSVKPHVLSRPIVRRTFDERFQHGTPVKTAAPPHFFNFLGSSLFSPAGYVPQVSAIWLGKAAGLSVEGILRLGRLFNALVSLLLIYWAIRLTPIGAMALIWVGLLPMTAAASAALGQDWLVISGACLLTAVGLRVVLNGRWKRSELLITATLAILLTVSKLIYLPLAMAGGQPFVRGKFQPRRMAVPLLICIAAAGLAGVWLNAISGLVVRPLAGIPPAGERLATWAHHPAQFLTLLNQTYVAHGMELVDTLFEFGWLNVPVGRGAFFFSMLALGLVIVAGDSAAGRLEWQMRVWLLLIAISIILLLSLALCLYWTPASESWIQGLQGRYFIPVAAPVLIAALPKRGSLGRFANVVPLLMVGANLVALASIVRAFYVF
jgi:uncharacterized membrane protein